MNQHNSENPGTSAADKKHEDRFLWKMIAGVIVAWAIYAAVAITCNEKWENWGTFGDFFGALNTLFSGLAFAILISTIRLQKQELQLQREEMQLQRHEMEGSRKELEGQKTNLARQNELTALSVRLSVLPNLIALEKGAIASLGYDKWVNANHSIDKVREFIDQKKKEGIHLATVELPRAEVAHKQAIIYGINEPERVREQIEKNRALVPRVERLAFLISDMEEVYRRLGTIAIRSGSD